MLTNFKDFLTYNKSERNGIFILLVLIFLSMIFNLSSPLFFGKTVMNDPEFLVSINKTIAQNQSIDSLKNMNQQTDSIQYFTFDPNTINKNGWKKLGLSSKQISVIENYKQKGGRFYKKEDLKKIYSITDETYQRLAEFIHINSQAKKPPSKNFKPRVKNPVFSNKTKTIVEINTADSVKFVQLKGIGPVFASRIIKYRKILGGFYNKSQLLEVYGMKRDRLSAFENTIIIDTNHLVKIKINSIAFKKLLKHPYFSYPLTKEIFQSLNRKKFNSIRELQKLENISDSLYQKIIPYLSFD